MTRSTPTARINKIVPEKQLPKLLGHGIRVGPTLGHLLRGVPFDIVKAMGLWQQAKPSKAVSENTRR